jgi:AcrR family transcriptional regulator
MSVAEKTEKPRTRSVKAVAKVAVKRVSTGNRRDTVAHQAVLDAATALLADRGPNGFAMEAVAKKAGVGKPTVYRWWPDRTDLLLELFNREILPPPTIPDDADLAEELKLRMKDLFAAWRDTPAGRVFRSLVVEMQATPETVARFRDEALAPRRRQSLRAFERARERGEIPEDSNLHALVDLVYGWAWYRLLTGQLVPDAEFDYALDTIAIGARGERTPPARKTRRTKTLVAV